MRFAQRHGVRRHRHYRGILSRLRSSGHWCAEGFSNRARHLRLRRTKSGSSKRYGRVRAAPKLHEDQSRPASTRIVCIQRKSVSPAPPILPEQAANAVDMLGQLLARARILTNVGKGPLGDAHLLIDRGYGQIGELVVGCLFLVENLAQENMSLFISKNLCPFA